MLPKYCTLDKRLLLNSVLTIIEFSMSSVIPALLLIPAQLDLLLRKLQSRARSSSSPLQEPDPAQGFTGLCAHEQRSGDPGRGARTALKSHSKSGGQQMLFCRERRERGCQKREQQRLSLSHGPGAGKRARQNGRATVQH